MLISDISEGLWSTRARLQGWDLKMWEMGWENGILIEGEWRRWESGEVQCGHRSSKYSDFSDCCMSKENFIRLSVEFGLFSCDYFSSSSTCKMRFFRARYMCEGRGMEDD